MPKEVDELLEAEDAEIPEEVEGEAEDVGGVIVGVVGGVVIAASIVVVVVCRKERLHLLVNPLLNPVVRFSIPAMENRCLRFRSIVFVIADVFVVVIAASERR